MSDEDAPRKRKRRAMVAVDESRLAQGAPEPAKSSVQELRERNDALNAENARLTAALAEARASLRALARRRG